MHLDSALKRKAIAGWVRQVRVPLVVNGLKVCTIVPDFLVTLPNGATEYHEYKGRPSREWRFKVRLFKALFPDATYRIIWHPTVALKQRVEP